MQTMAEYIEREKLIDELEHLHEDAELSYLGVYDCVKNVPTADVVEVVFCERCKDYEPHGNGKAGVCRNKKCTGLRYATDYCSYGERRCE